MREPEDFYTALVPLIESAGADWAVAGALAALRYRALPRATTDADLLVSWEPGLVEAMALDGWEVRAMAEPGDFPHLIRAKRNQDRVDLIVAQTDYQTEALRRAQDHVLTVEDVIVHKVVAWRARDQSDIRSILDSDISIDWTYVQRWLAQFGFEHRLVDLGIS